jgi:hypothetical protein
LYQLPLKIPSKHRTPAVSRARKLKRGSWVGARRVAVQHVSSRPPLRTGLTAFTVSGSTPSVHLHSKTMKRPFALLQLHRAFPVLSARMRWGPLLPSSHRLGAFAIRPHPGVRGFPTFRLLRPIRHLSGTSALRLGSSPSSCPLAFAFLGRRPVFSMEDSNGTMEVVCCSPCPIRALRLPRLGTEGRTGWPL